MKFLTFLLIAIFGFTLNVEARPTHGGKGSAVTAPVLTATSFTLGQQTQAYRGYVFLHALDQTAPSYIPFTTSGLGLMSPTAPACDTWYTTFVSGRSSTDFDISASVADASALTPLVNFNGQGHLTGDYVFNIQCSRGGIFSNTVTLTIHTIANAANIGAQDRLDFGWTIDNGTFGSQPNTKVLISTGSDWRGLANHLRGIGLVSSAGNHITVTIADSGRYPWISNFQMTGLSYIDISDVVAVGDADIQGAGTLFGIVGPYTSQGNSLINVRYYGNEYTLPRSSQNSGQDAFDMSFCTASCIVQDSIADFASSGFNVSDNVHISNVEVSHYNNNCAAIQSGVGNALVDNFTTCHDPLINLNGLHTDCLQVLDGATAYNVTIRNFWCIQAGAAGDPQGPIFGGSQIGSKNDPMTGYIDDCTSGHGPGHYFTSVTGSYLSSSGGAQLWAPGGGLPISDNARINFSDIVGSCIGLYNGATGTNISNRNVGSVGSPVAFSNVGAYSLQMEGIVSTLGGYNGFASAGESGTSFLRYFGYVQHRQNPFPHTTFTGTVNGVVGSHASGTTISVTSGFGVSNYPNVMEPIISGGLTYTGCAGCGGQNGPGICCELSSTEATVATANATFSTGGSCNGSPCGYMTISGPCTGRFDYNLSNGSQMGGLMISGSGIPEGVSISVISSYPADGCAGTYTLNTNAVGTLGTTAVTGKPQNGSGLYTVYFGPLPPGGPYTDMAASEADDVSFGSGAQVSQDQSGGSPGCVSNLHQGTFAIDKGYATWVSTCGVDAPNTTVTNVAQSPVGLNFATGIIPYTTLSATTASTWNAMTVAQKRAYICNKMLPAAGQGLDLGGGVFIGPFTATGELQQTGGNIIVPGCGGH